jgi:hypothetical protein
MGKKISTERKGGQVPQGTIRRKQTSLQRRTHKSLQESPILLRRMMRSGN